MPKLDQVVRTTVEDSLARAPRRYMVWHTVKQYAPDEAALDILSYILSTGRTSRLQSKLLYEKEMVASVGGGNNTGEIGGTFQIQATARPGKNLDDIEAEINKEIERIKKEPPTAEEIARARNSIQSQTHLRPPDGARKGQPDRQLRGLSEKSQLFPGRSRPVQQGHRR